MILGTIYIYHIGEFVKYFKPSSLSYYKVSK